MVNLDTEKGKCPDITSAAMMEECENKEHDDEEMNETYSNIYNVNKEE